ncbi:CLUMA_CG018473, isoform A [Clunio marinus]|uniref:CLUMA_CG018473, isoform A n=1 Tax=Clunio marinus TaxID=568069 RepID=A0A1J1IZ55_9DIPT|nr:CLUMA_CG018473, isoform A [Clunio marinus]
MNDTEFHRATLAEKEVNTLKEQLTSTATSKTQTNTTLSNSTTTTTITQNGTSPPSPSTTPLSLLSDNNDNHNTSNKLLNNNSIKSCHLDDENMDKKLNDVNEMIDNNHEDDDDVKEETNHCTSNRSTPTSEKEKNVEDDDMVDNDDENATESHDNGDRCSVKSGNVNNNNSVSTRTMAEELALKDKESTDVTQIEGEKVLVDTSIQ